MKEPGCLGHAFKGGERWMPAVGLTAQHLHAQRRRQARGEARGRVPPRLAVDSPLPLVRRLRQMLLFRGRGSPASLGERQRSAHAYSGLPAPSRGILQPPQSRF